MASQRTAGLYDLISPRIFFDLEVLARRFLSIEDDGALKGNKELEIRVKADPDAKTITIECACFVCILQPN